MPKSVNFSPSQQKAITQKGTNILVSAGAGSGKTTVLTERISRQVQEGTPITRFLVLTFTEAAANEMKQRIRREVTKTKGEEGALLVDESHIETFDAFALWLVKKYSYALGISSDISIIDKGIMHIKVSETIKEVIEENLSNPDFFNLYTKYSYKTDKIIADGIESIYKLANKQLDKEQFFNTYVSNTYNEFYINSLINEATKKSVDFFNEASIKIANIDDEKLEEGYLNFYTKFFDVTDFDELRDLVLNSDRYPSKNKNISRDDLKIHNYLKGKYNGEIKPYFQSGSRNEIIQEYMSHKKEAEVLFEMAREVDRRLDEFKRKNGVYDFSDISFLANKLFRENQDIVNEVASMFDYIFVDEYQDTNDIQEYIISKLGRDNVYMVGDIKQSIYRFRNADCEIFNKKFNKYKKGEEGIEVDLNNNFRSRPQVVEGVNHIFSYLMDPEDNPTTRIDYQQGHHFEEGEGQEVFKKHEDESEYGFIFKEYDYDPTKKIKEHEANLIADDIIHKVNTGFKIYDKKLDETRPCRYSDFAILCDTATHFATVQKVFNQRNIPLVLKADESSLDIVFARIIKNIVKLIYFTKTNKIDDDFRHAYMSISRSPIFKESDQTLYDKLKEKNPEILINNIKNDKLYKIVDEIAKESDDLSLSEIMSEIYDKFDLTSCIFKLGSYEKNTLLWDQFVANSIDMEKLGFTLKEYVDYFDSLDNLQISLDVPSIQDVDNAVSLSTIHKAKGLEYHIVYLPFLDGNIHGKAISEIPQIWASQTHGLIFPKMDLGMENSFIKKLALQKEREEVFNEKIRLLYVAMTRCMDETILIMSHESPSANNCTFIPDAKKYTHLFRYLRDYGIVDFEIVEPTNEPVVVHEKTYHQDEFNLEEFNYDYKENPKHKASKELHLNNPELLQYGTNVHYLMEHIDYETKDTSFIKDKKIKHDIDKILDMPIFQGVKNDNILHEYEFYDEENNVHGIIDCLIIKDDHIDIIDFKLKNIADESYHRQLNTYRKYIEKVSNLPIHMYLLSIFDTILEEVDYEDN
ncbi:MAG: UvrD-helicase domain-containing protein [Coprobacillus sp.]|nr:UvrD-helicase domain-containing protein [Coprobacillus sp.]